jgi:hypothetical protein
MRELILRDYEILSEVGRDAMGVVYKARQYSPDRLVMLKVLAPELARDESYVERFKRQAAAATTVAHPNVVAVYEAGAHLNRDTGERQHYFVMEHVEGETVEQRLTRLERLSANEAAVIGARVAEGLAAAWKKARMMHGDIRPENIFLLGGGDVKIAGLGFARNAGAGDVACVSPEQARGKADVDFRGEIYSLGCVLYRMLCGQYPFTGPAAHVIALHLNERPSSIRTIVPDCPMSIVRVVERMLAKDPADRQQSYAELIEDLRHAHERILFRDTPEAVAAEMAAPASRSRLAWGVVGVAAVAVITGALWWTFWRTGGQNREKAPALRPDLVAAQAAPVARKPAGDDVPLAVPPVIVTQTNLPAQPPAKPAAVAPSDVATNRPVADGPPPLPPKPAVKAAPAAADLFLKDVAALSPEKRVVRVVAKLKELNPKFDGKETHKIENGAVTELALSTIGVADITPLKALPCLRRLTLASSSPAQKGALSNLSPLRGLPLAWLYCQNNPIRDLAPLHGMSLAALSVGFTLVSDLSPLAGMKLAVLSINDTPVSDLTPLAGMPLTVLWCNNARITDLSPLRDMPLKELRCDFVPARDAALLRGIKSLAKINDVAAAVFWQRVGPVAANVTAPSCVQAERH